MIKSKGAAFGDSNHEQVSWAEGAVILGLAAVISKLLGTLQKIPFQNIAGDEAFGIYSAVYPFYILILFLATAGFPLAVSSFVSQHVAMGRHEEAVRVLRISSVILCMTGIIAFVLMFFGAGQLAALIGNAETKAALQSVSFAVLFVPIMAALRGFFQGYGQMAPTGYSQVAEQFIRVLTMVILLLYLTEAGASSSEVAAGGTFGSVTGAIAGLVVMVVYWRKRRQNFLSAVPIKGTTSLSSSSSSWRLGKQLIMVAIPICLGAIAVPILNIVDTFTLPRLIRSEGYDDVGAMREFGVYSRGLPLVQLVAMLVSSISVAIVPAIAEAKARKDNLTIHKRASSAMKLTWLIGLAASFGLAVTALPINIMLYKDSTGTTTMAILGFAAVFSILNITSASILQGIGSVKLPAIHLFIAAGVKIALNVAFVPIWGISGAALSAVLAFAIAALLNIIALHRHIDGLFGTADYVYRPLVAICLMVLTLTALIWGTQAALSAIPLSLSFRLNYAITALLAVIGGAIIYLLLIVRIGGITSSELASLPGVKARLLPWLQRRRWIREN